MKFDIFMFWITSFIGGGFLCVGITYEAGMQLWVGIIFIGFSIWWLKRAYKDYKGKELKNKERSERK